MYTPENSSFFLYKSGVRGGSKLDELVNVMIAMVT